MLIREQAPPLLVSDIAVDSHENPSVIRIFLKRAKCDPFGKGIFIFIGRVRSSPICPVSAILGYMAIRPASPGPLFVWRDGTPLSRSTFVGLLRRALVSLSLDQQSYSGHSFRIGAATSAAMAGVPDHIIKMMGRWSSEAYQVYIRTPREVLSSISQVLAC